MIVTVRAPAPPPRRGGGGPGAAGGGPPPTAWRLREAPVTRWVVLGGVAGVGLGWLVLLLGGLAS
ncbi:DUF2537 domain-containing protein [Nocardia brasiliensis]|uniref:DUF2537 domain-containing protein n=1 Tax=Nocardia brasiliensis TaxID=37326 RepID=UPI0024548956|nr:DUF2537 domain-containing protein [Nocardia brasiliensis]